MRTFASAFILFILALSSVSYGQVAANSGASSERTDNPEKNFFPVGDLKEGMRGTARTVFSGSRSEEFNVEILGVLPGWIGPKQDLIVGRISGGQADRTKVFAGMSGSPVYIDGKLVGAISYSFPFATEAICGITPIEQMISIFEQEKGGKASSSSPKTFSFAELAASEWLPDLADGSALSQANTVSGSSSNPLGAAVSQTFRPISVPVSFSGISQATLNRFAPQLLKAGLLPVSAPVGAARTMEMKEADENTLLGGDSVVIHLTTGDISMAASGTVTLRDGNKIYAFGHPFLAAGASSLPMSESHVVTVVPNINNSFKLAVPDGMVGRMTQDRNTGVFGELGQAPKMIPVRINLRTSRNKLETLEFSIANDELLSPLLVNMALINTIMAYERGLGDLTIEVNGKVNLNGHDPVNMKGRFGGPMAVRLAAGTVVVPVGNLLVSRFDNLSIKGIEVDLSLTEGNKVAALERIEVDRTEARAGETINIQAFVRGDSGRVFTQQIPFTIPKGTPEGSLTIEVGDGAKLQEKSASKKFVPDTLAELIGKINEVKKNDRLYVQSYRTTKGAIVGSNEMPNLPPSVLATMNNNRSAGGFKPTVETLVSEVEVAPAEFIVTGQQSIKIQIIR
ncbi:MAG: hypothetical protein DWQ47_00615 [Acidobacteria bacterium]|nr:MAG: hypothetical protein DWQ32_11075 [Acidobacteriota bacterium]REK04012.1 MAG: hypothetical protein DWQ38_00600 [Acidobacteriota bacterium]REK15174.1 MAG: hypothetical protein DWQ43_16765 [Acidobacteriota bacterium]REK46264.1 MAG: hypothetical protein DWQ47_00615 [Acidobacteriota bacterium]